MILLSANVDSVVTSIKADAGAGVTSFPAVVRSASYVAPALMFHRDSVVAKYWLTVAVVSYQYTLRISSAATRGMTATVGGAVVIMLRSCVCLSGENT